jgi:hypothetical protein
MYITCAVGFGAVVASMAEMASMLVYSFILLLFINSLANYHFSGLQLLVASIIGLANSLPDLHSVLLATLLAGCVSWDGKQELHHLHFLQLPRFRV